MKGTVSGITKSAALALSLACLAAPVSTACPCSEVRVPETARAEADQAAGLAFSKSAEYRREFKRAIAEARAALAKSQGASGVAIVSDIDETIIDNREGLARRQDFDREEFFKYMAEAKAPLLKPTADLLSWARKRGYAVFFVTGRRESLRRATIENLVRNGVAYDGLYMRADGDKSPAEAVKVPLREAIEKMGFRIVLNIGDQYSDLTGGHGQECVKLPNRMYFVD